MCLTAWLNGRSVRPSAPTSYSGTFAFIFDLKELLLNEPKYNFYTYAPSFFSRFDHNTHYTDSIASVVGIYAVHMQYYSREASLFYQIVGVTSSTMTEFSAICHLSYCFIAGKEQAI